MDIQETQPESEEDSSSESYPASLLHRLGTCWERLVAEFLNIGNGYTLGTVRHEKFTHTAIMRRLNHPDS